MLHCDLRVRWKVASDLRFRAAISGPGTSSFCEISGYLAPSTRKSLAIAIVRFWCAKVSSSLRPRLSASICTVWTQRRRDDNKIEFLLLRGGLRGREENRPKTLVFVGNATTIKF